jgi:hypothetical protein
LPSVSAFNWKSSWSLLGRVAIAFEGEAFALECLTKRFDTAWQWFCVNGLNALCNLCKGQWVARATSSAVAIIASDPRRTITAVTPCQAAHPAVAPRMGPVIDRLTAHTELLSDGVRLNLAPKHQRAHRSRAYVPMLVIDRQLLLNKLTASIGFF